MAQPTPYNRLFSLEEEQNNNPAAPYDGAQHDAEFNAIEQTLDETLTNVALIQRDDGALQNRIVRPDSLSVAVLNMFGNWNPRGNWAALTHYAFKDVVGVSGASYVAVSEHVSTASFANDLSTGYWMSIDGLAALALPTGAELIGYQLDATGSVARTQHDKNADFVSVKDFGAVGDGVTNDTSAINAAIAHCDPNGPKLYVPTGTYLVTSPLTTITGQFSMEGDGRQQSVFLFNPSANGACFTLSNGAAVVGNCSMKGFGIRTTDTTYTKVAMDLYDLTTCHFEDIYILGNGTGVVGSPAAGLYWSGGTGSIGIRTHGRDSTGLRGIEIIADYPVYVAANPNSVPNDGEDMDHWTWRDCYFLASGHYAFTVADGLGVSDLSFDGYQAWVGGTGGFYMNDTRAAPTVYSHGIMFKELRGEQCTDANGYWININAAFRVGSIIMENVFGNSSAQGIKIDRVLKLDLGSVTMATAAGKDCIKVTTPDSDSVISMRNCEWQSGSVFTLTNYTACMIAAFNATNFAGPNTAVYVANNDQAGTLFNGGPVTAKAAADADTLVGKATSGGNRFRVRQSSAGNGVVIRTDDDAGTSFVPMIFNASYFAGNNKIYPGSDAAAFQTSCGLYAGNGAPNNANGSNGDYYLRGDGTAGGNTAIYHKEGGSWVALTTT